MSASGWGADADQGENYPALGHSSTPAPPSGDQFFTARVTHPIGSDRRRRLRLENVRCDMQKGPDHAVRAPSGRAGGAQWLYEPSISRLVTVSSVLPEP